MPKFNVGDRVARTDSLAPAYMKEGVITRVIPHDDLPAEFAEYEIDFKFAVATFYERQLTFVGHISPKEDAS